MTTPAQLQEVADRLKETQPYLGVRLSDDRRRITAVRPTITGCDIIVGCDEYGCNEVYSYDSMTKAALAWIRWSGNRDSEPDGWIRHMPSGRRRPDGDATQEHVHP